MCCPFHRAKSRAKLEAQKGGKSQLGSRAQALKVKCPKCFTPMSDYVRKLHVLLVVRLPPLLTRLADHAACPFLPTSAAPATRPITTRSMSLRPTSPSLLIDHPPRHPHQRFAPEQKNFKEHFEAKHPKDPLPAEDTLQTA